MPKVGDLIYNTQWPYYIEYIVISIDEKEKTFKVKVNNTWFMETEGNA